MMQQIQQKDNRDNGGGGKSLVTKEKMKASWASNP